MQQGDQINGASRNGSATSRGSGFVRMVRSEATLELMQDPLAFTLLAQIAYRAQWKSRFNRLGLEVGEALIGDYSRIGMTRRKQRTRLKRLETWGFVTTRTTNQGTIAKLVNSEVFNLSYSELVTENGQQNDQQSTNGGPTSDQQATSGGPLPRRIRRRKGLKGKELSCASRGVRAPEEEIWGAYPKKVAKPKGLRAIKKALRTVPAAVLLERTQAFAFMRPNKNDRYTPHPATWFNEERYNDDPKTWKPEINETSTHRGALTGGNRNIGTANESGISDYSTFGKGG